MTSEDQSDSTQPQQPMNLNLREKVEAEYRKIREHAETYPYVWSSYIFVYGGLALWTTYRWRKLRNTENRVRVLQERLRKLVEEEEKAAATSVTSMKPSSSIDKPKD